MSRKPLIAGNWKMNLNHFEAIALVQKIAFSLPDKYFDRVDVTVIPPFTDLRSVQTLVDGDKLRLTYGAQDVSQHDSGAYTGEISGAFLAKLGCTFAVVGHSERRTYHGETDELVAAKAKAALKHGLTPIVCIGEQLEVLGLQVAFSTAAVVLAQTFVALPFLVVSLEGALRTAGRRYDIVAASLGAGPTTVFRRVTLPLVLPGLVSGSVLAFARSLGEFGATITFAGSLQGVTRTLPLEIYKQRETDVDAAVALSLVLVVVAVLVIGFARQGRSAG